MHFPARVVAVWVAERSLDGSSSGSSWLRRLDVGLALRANEVRGVLCARSIQTTGRRPVPPAAGWQPLQQAGSLLSPEGGGVRIVIADCCLWPRCHCLWLDVTALA